MADDILRKLQVQVEVHQGLIDDTKVENVTLRLLCGFLLGQLAMAGDDPKTALGKMTARLHGIHEALALGSPEGDRAETQKMTETVENICRIAELTIRMPPPPEV